MPPEVNNLIAAIATLVNNLNETVGLPNNLSTGRDLRYNAEKTRVSPNINLPVEIGEVSEGDKGWNSIAKIFTNTQLKSIPPSKPPIISKEVNENFRFEKETVREIPAPVENVTTTITNASPEGPVSLNITPFIEEFSAINKPIITTQQVDTEQLASAVKSISNIDIEGIVKSLPKPSIESIVNVNVPDDSPPLNIPEIVSAPVVIPDINIPEIVSAPVVIPDINIPEIVSAPVVIPDINIPEMVSSPVVIPDINIPEIVSAPVVIPDINIPEIVSSPVIVLPEMVSAPVVIPDINIPEMAPVSVVIPDINIPEIVSAPAIAPEVDLSFIENLVAKPAAQPIIDISPIPPDIFVSPNINVDSAPYIPNNNLDNNISNTAFKSFAPEPPIPFGIDPILDAISNVKIYNTIQTPPSVPPSFIVTPTINIPPIEAAGSLETDPILKFLEKEAINSQILIRGLISDNLIEARDQPVMESPQISILPPIAEKPAPTLNVQPPNRDDTYSRVNLEELKAQTQLLSKIANKIGIPSQQINMAAANPQSYSMGEPPRAGAFYTPVGETMLNINNVGQVI